MAGFKGISGGVPFGAPASQRFASALGRGGSKAPAPSAPPAPTTSGRVRVDAHLAPAPVTDELVANLSVQADIPIEALPGANLINRLVTTLKEGVNDGQSGCSCKSACAYLGFRLISYSGLPLALNVLSVVVSALFCLISLPLLCCSKAPLRWSSERLKDSLVLTVTSLFDLTCDLRMVTGSCCCDEGSLYLQV
ncbi:hypothetical protein ACFLR2_01065 [Chlamydiota bacterium]